MNTQDRIALPLQVSGDILAYLENRPWKEVNHLIAAFANTAMRATITMPEPAPVGPPDDNNPKH